MHTSHHWYGALQQLSRRTLRRRHDQHHRASAGLRPDQRLASVRQGTVQPRGPRRAVDRLGTDALAAARRGHAIAPDPKARPMVLAGPSAVSRGCLIMCSPARCSVWVSAGPAGPPEAAGMSPGFRQATRRQTVRIRKSCGWERAGLRLPGQTRTGPQDFRIVTMNRHSVMSSSP